MHLPPLGEGRCALLGSSFHGSSPRSAGASPGQSFVPPAPVRVRALGDAGSLPVLPSVCSRAGSPCGVQPEMLFKRGGGFPQGLKPPAVVATSGWSRVALPFWKLCFCCHGPSIRRFAAPLPFLQRLRVSINHGFFSVECASPAGDAPCHQLCLPGVEMWCLSPFEGSRGAEEQQNDLAGDGQQSCSRDLRLSSAASVQPG